MKQRIGVASLAFAAMVVGCGRTSLYLPSGSDPPQQLPPSDGSVRPPMDAGVPHAPPDLGMPHASPDLGAHPPVDLGSPSNGLTQATNFRIDPAHTGAQPDETMTPPLTVAWTIDAGGPVTYPLLADGRVFVTTGGWSLSLQPGSVTALDRMTGTTLWGPLALGNEPLAAYDRGTLFVVNFDGKLIALDGASGQTKWSLQLANPYILDSPPVAVDGVVYVQADSLYAVDEETGTILWKTVFYGTDGAVAVQNGTVYAGESCGQASAHDAATGGLLWHHSTDCGGGGGSTPTIFDGRLYVRYLPWRYSTWGDQILDATTGSLLDKFVSLQPPAFADGVGYYLDDSGTLSAVSVSTGMLAWSFVGDGSLTSAPLVAGSYVYVGSDSGSLYALDTSGQVVWTTSVGGAINSNQEISSMAAAEGTLLVAVGNQLVALH